MLQSKQALFKSFIVLPELHFALLVHFIFEMWTAFEFHNLTMSLLCKFQQAAISYICYVKKCLFNVCLKSTQNIFFIQFSFISMLIFVTECTLL